MKRRSTPHGTDNASSGRRVLKRATYNFAYPQLFSGGRFDNGIPNTTFAGKGATNFSGPSGSLLSPTTDIAIFDNVTYIRGKHSLKTDSYTFGIAKIRMAALATPGRWLSIRTPRRQPVTPLLMPCLETSGLTVKRTTIRSVSSDSIRKKRM